MTGGKPGVPAELMRHLSEALMEVEGARRARDSTQDLTAVLEEVLALRRALERTSPERVPPELPGLVESAEGDLRSGALEDARESLLGVGRAIDAFLRRE